MKQLLVYVSNSYQAPSGMKGFVLEELAKYDCKVIQWGETGTTEGNLKQIREQVDIMLMVTPVKSHCSDGSGVGKGQESELEAYMLGREYDSANEKVYILEQEPSNPNNLIFKKFGSWYDNDGGDSKFDVSIISHKGGRVLLNEIFSKALLIEKVELARTNSVNSNNTVHLALYNKVL
jgi:hypothetical protein